MFHSYASKPFQFSSHHATLRERIRAARYMSESEARKVVAEYTDIPQEDDCLFRHAVAVVVDGARNVKEAREGGYLDLIWDGFSVEEVLAQRAVEAVNEVLAEAMAS